MVNSEISLDRLKQFGPKAYIHLDRLCHNYSEIQNHAKSCEIMSIVKTNAYGHGAVLISKALAKFGCKWFGVFTYEEGIELRKGGIKQNIFVLSKMNIDSIESAIEFKFSLNLSSWEDFSLLKNYYQKYKVLPKVHIKIDTGMSRLGFDFSDVEKVLDKISSFKELECEGVYSHFSTADEGDLGYAKTQLSRFQSMLDKAKKNEIFFRFIHCSNSGSLLNLPESQFNMFRVGLLLYGALPSKEVPTSLPIKPVMDFKGTIVSLRKVRGNTPVSYGGIWISTKETTIGVIQTGFADGLPRPWYEKGVVGYNGRYYPISGRICMDQFMVDFGDDTVQIGDDVLLWGDDGENKISVEKISDVICSTPYVVFTSLSERVKRIDISE